MNFVREKIKDFYLLDSRIENIFINEYLPAAPGDYVKVYIYGYMYAEFGLEMTDKVMAKQLGIPEKKIIDAWNYWEKMGAIKKLYVDSAGDIDFTVEFINLKELMYGKSTEAIPEEHEPSPEIFGNDQIKKVFDRVEQLMARSLSSTEVTRILSWMTDDKVPPEVMLYGISYCLEKHKSSLNYIESVLRNWMKDGLYTVDAVNEHLQDVDQRFYQYRRVLKALGFNRNATEAEKQMMDNWFDSLGYNMDRVLEACTKTVGISSPNFSYVNKVLQNWKDEAAKRGDSVNKKVTVTQSVLNQYYDYLREEAINAAESRTKEIYEKIPRIKDIDDKVQTMGSALSKALLLGNEEDKGLELRQQMDQLAAERAVLLTENNFEMDYTDIKYACDKCNDTGITDLGERCSCAKERMEEAEVWQKTKNEA
ncbi:DnaD domain protein [Aminicella lysinilytica]|jgi:DnaD/phage-associated family protein|uniref:DnaD/phage-associated family protein n=1 Tax=Aminicella lysinilytica TaxID=433323 RepID=A0A4R6QCA5_9FIRM|nr:DnaD domain protein [Aminicella lysinilytica]NLD10772.1 DnaD domain protein [Clostridiales bacterium]TDP58979.1 DnaD/phage-associated family protein [Aminicella lysinilytica]